MPPASSREPKPFYAWGGRCWAPTWCLGRVLLRKPQQSYAGHEGRHTYILDTLRGSCQQCPPDAQDWSSAYHQVLWGSPKSSVVREPTEAPTLWGTHGPTRWGLGRSSLSASGAGQGLWAMQPGEDWKRDDLTFLCQRRTEGQDLSSTPTPALVSLGPGGLSGPVGTYNLCTYGPPCLGHSPRLGLDQQHTSTCECGNPFAKSQKCPS